MSFHQFRLIRTFPYQARAAMYREHIPEFEIFIADEDPQYKSYPEFTDREMYFHEMAHCMEMVVRGKFDRLKVDNFGWPKNEVGWFSPASANSECIVVALAILLEDRLTGTIRTDMLNNPSVMSTFIQAHQHKKRPFLLKEWIAERSAKLRIEDAVKEYKTSFEGIFRTTTKFIAEECAEFV